MIYFLFFSILISPIYFLWPMSRKVCQDCLPLYLMTLRQRGATKKDASFGLLGACDNRNRTILLSLLKILLEAVRPLLRNLTLKGARGNGNCLWLSTRHDGDVCVKGFQSNEIESRLYALLFRNASCKPPFTSRPLKAKVRDFIHSPA